MTRSFFRGAIYLTLIELIVKGRAFIALPLLTAYLGAEQFGIWSQTATLAAALLPLIVLGTDSAMIRFMPGLPDAEQKRCFSAWVLSLLAATLVTAVFLKMAAEPAASIFFGKSSYASYVPLAILLLVANLLLNSLRNWYRMRNHTRGFGAISAIQAMTSLAALYLGIAQKWELATLIQVVAGADILLAVGALLFVAMNEGLAMPDFSILPKLLSFGLPLVPMGLSMWGLNSADRLFLAEYGSMREIGIYSLVYQVGNMGIQLLVSPIWAMYAGTAAESFNKGIPEEVQRLFDRSLAAILLLALPSILGLLVLGRDLLALIATPEYYPGAPIMAIVALGYLALMISAYFETSLGLHQKQYLGTVASLIAFSVNMVANMILIPRYTIMGAGIATTLGLGSQLLFSMWAATRYDYIRVRADYPLRVLLATLVMALPLYFISLRLPGGTIWLVLKIILGMVLFLVATMLFKLLPYRSLVSLPRSFMNGK